MSCGTDASTGECDYEGNTSLISLCHLADVPHQDACETSSFSHLSPLRPSRLVFKLQCEEGHSDSGLWVQERKGFCCSASASAAKEDFSLAVSSTALCLCGKRLRRKILIEHRAVVMHCSTGDQHCYKSCNILELVISEYYIWFGCRVSVEKKPQNLRIFFLKWKRWKMYFQGNLKKWSVCSWISGWFLFNRELQNILLCRGAFSPLQSEDQLLLQYL